MESKKYLIVNGIINKADNSKISESEMDIIMPDFIKILEEKDFTYGGGFGLYTEEETNLYFRNF